MRERGPEGFRGIFIGTFYLMIPVCRRRRQANTGSVLLLITSHTSFSVSIWAKSKPPRPGFRLTPEIKRSNRSGRGVDELQLPPSLDLPRRAVLRTAGN